MKLTHFIALIALVVTGLVVGTVLISNEQGKANFQQGNLIEDFDFAALHQVKLSGSQGKVTLSKVLEQWQVEQVTGYTADTSKLSKLLQSLKQVQIAQLKTSKPEHFAKLGVAGIEQENTKAMQVSLSNGKKTIELLLGAKANSGKGQYARWLGVEQALLLDRTIEINTQASSWLDKRIFSIPFDSVRTLLWQAQESEFKVRRAELAVRGKVEQNPKLPAMITLPTGKVNLARDFELIYPATDKDTEYPSVFTGLVRNTLQLTLQNVKPLSWLASQKEPLQQTLTLTLRLAEQEQKARVQLTFYQTQEQQAWLVVEGRNWAYQIPKHSYQQLAQPLSAYLLE